MAIVNGTVEAVSTKFGKYGIALGGKWYNTNPDWLPAKPEKGDVVEFDDGGRNYIKQLKIVSGGITEPSSPAPSGKPAYSAPGGRTFPVGVTAPERTINRQNALTNAVAMTTAMLEALGADYYKGSDIRLAVIDTARLFEAYTTGDLDLEEAKKALDDMGA